MGIYNYYQQIAEENQLEFNFDDKYYSGKTALYDVGSISVDYYTFQKKVNKTHITLKNELGNTNLGYASFEIPNKPGLYQFNTTISNVFWSIFNKKAKRIKVESKNEQIQRKIERLLEDSGIENIAKELNFEPLIQFEYKDNKWVFTLRYSLQFSGKENAVMPIFKFCELFIKEVS